jgi:hypothetical protein
VLRRVLRQVQREIDDQDLVDLFLVHQNGTEKGTENGTDSRLVNPQAVRSCCCWNRMYSVMDPDLLPAHSPQLPMGGTLADVAAYPPQLPMGDGFADVAAYSPQLPMGETFADVAAYPPQLPIGGGFADVAAYSPQLSMGGPVVDLAALGPRTVGTGVRTGADVAAYPPQLPRGGAFADVAAYSPQLSMGGPGVDLAVGPRTVGTGAGAGAVRPGAGAFRLPEAATGAGVLLHLGQAATAAGVDAHSPQLTMGGGVVVRTRWCRRPRAMVGTLMVAYQFPRTQRRNNPHSGNPHATSLAGNGSTPQDRHSCAAVAPFFVG